MLRLAVGAGVVLDGDPGPFHDRRARPATPDEVRAWAERTARRTARLPVGTLALADGVAAELDAGGFDRHTFLCGQSGSGKSYSLGLVLEQLLLRTGLRIVILDPNSDFARFRELRDDVDPDTAARWRELAGSIAIQSAHGDGDDRLRLRLGDLAADHQGAVLQLDPVADREEYAELRGLIADRAPGEPRGAPVHRAARGAGARAAHREPRHGLARHLGARPGPHRAGRAGRRVGPLPRRRHRLARDPPGADARRELRCSTASGALRKDRSPVLLVIDEAHNVCPAAPADPLTALATETTVQIAGEGRKFGLHLLVATQRPAKVHENVLSQCDNLILMRMNSPGDAAIVRDTLGFAPPGLVGRSTGFGLGEALIAGKIAPHPALIRFGRRVTREGGGDVGSDWAAPRG